MAVDPIQFMVGPVSMGAARILALGVAVYAVLTAKHTWTAYQNGLEDRGSSMLATWVMAGLTILLWTDGARLLPAPYSVFVIVVYMAGVTITFAYTMSNAEKRLMKLREEMQALMDEWRDKLLPESDREAWFEHRLRELGHEEKRKTPHLMMSIFVAVYVVLGYFILRGVEAMLPAGMGRGEGIHNLDAALDAGVLASGHVVALTALLSMLFLLLPVEMVRLRFPQLGYPFKGTITSMLREKEAGLFGAHYYITATLPLAILWLTGDPTTWDSTLFAVLAVIGVTVFADTASALIGIRYGRTKWPHSPNKTYVGSIGGSVVAFIVALPFVGLPVAIISAIVFLLVDVVAPVPLHVSDNILNPLGLAAAYIIFRDHLEPWLPFY